MRKLRILLIPFFLIGLFLTGCSDKAEQERTEGKIIVYTSIFPIEDFTKRIGGNHVYVKNIIPPGADAHTFEPSQKTVIDIAEADAFIYNGLGLEPFITNMKDSLKNEDVLFTEASEGIVAEEGAHEDEHSHEEEDQHGHGDVNPHIWIDPIRATSMAQNIKNTLIELKPEAKDEFEANFEKLKVQLEELDQEFSSMVKSAQKQEFLVSHAAYEYWEERYGLKQISITGLSPTNEPSQTELKSIIDYAKKHDIRYVLFEQNVTPKVADVIKSEIGADVLYLHNVAVLTEEDMKNKEDYFTLMRQNIKTLETVLSTK